MNRIEGIEPLKRNPAHFQAYNRAFEVSAEAETAVINIYEEIGYWGVTASMMRRTLDAIDSDSIELRINSPGGDVFDGIAIYNDLLDHPAKVNVKVTGLAASAASLIAMAGDSIEMNDTAFLMIHNAWAIALGDHQVMADMVTRLQKIDGSLVKAYAEKSGMDEEDIKEMMNSETWLSADEAKENGFIDKITKGEQPKALFDLSVYAHVPGKLKRQIEAGLRDSGLSRREAKTAIAEGFPQLDAVESRLSQCDAGGLSPEYLELLNTFKTNITGIRT